VIQNLMPYTEYRITARSVTLEGEGRMSDPIFIWTAALGKYNHKNFVQCVVLIANVVNDLPVILTRINSYIYKKFGNPLKKGMQTKKKEAEKKRNNYLRA